MELHFLFQQNQIQLLIVRQLLLRVCQNPLLSQWDCKNEDQKHWFARQDKNKIIITFYYVFTICAQKLSKIETY